MTSTSITPQTLKAPSRLPVQEERFLRLPAVKIQTGISRSSIYARMKLGTFPTSIQIEPNTVAWRSCDIASWMADHILASAKPQHDKGEMSA